MSDVEAKTTGMPLPDGLVLREVRDEDSQGIIDLIALCYREFPGCILDVEREEPQLLRPSRAYPGFWVVVRGASILGTIGCADHRDPDGRTVAELKKLYLHPSIRGRGLARLLVEFAERWSVERGAVAIELWSDTRFLTAHAVYLRLGYERTGGHRELHDLSHTEEFHFLKRLVRAAR